MNFNELDSVRYNNRVAPVSLSSAVRSYEPRIDRIKSENFDNDESLEGRFFACGKSYDSSGKKCSYDLKGKSIDVYC